jgi:hypothetical protein
MQQLDRLATEYNQKLKFIWLEGNSTDDTVKKLSYAGRYFDSKNIDVELVKFDTTYPYIQGGVNPLRWERLASSWNKCIDRLTDSKYTVCVESDLLWDPRTLMDLTTKINDKVNVIYPQLFHSYPNISMFYDTHGFTIGEKGFGHEAPFYDSKEVAAKGYYEDENIVQITTGGGMIVSDYEHQKDGRFGLHDCIMHYPESTKLFMSKHYKIHHRTTEWQTQNFLTLEK